MLSASANKLSRLKEQAEEYAALIMEELDPERLGYIEVGPLFIWYSDVSMTECFLLCFLHDFFFLLLVLKKACSRIV